VRPAAGSGAASCALLVAAWTIFASPLCAQESAGVLTAPQVFDLADARRDAGAVEDALTLYAALAGDADAEVRAEARYRRGLLLADLGRYEEAAVAFRALLDERPDALAGRLELARMFAALGLEPAARRELRQAQVAGIPPEAAGMVDQFAAALRSPARVGGSLEFSLAPDTNINRATQARTLDTIIAPLTLSDDARAQSGVGGRVAGQVYIRAPLSQAWSIVPRASGLATVYDDSRFNDISASGLVGLEWRGGADRISASLGQTFRWFAGDLYARTDVVAMDWVRLLERSSQLLLSISAADARYEQNALQNGELYDVSGSYERAINSRSGVSLTASVTRQVAADPGYATWAGGLTTGAWRETPFGTVFTSLGVRRTEGDERLFLFPERRKEWLVTARAGMSLRALTVARMAPTVRINFEDNSSTVGIYDYRRVAVEIGVTRAF
jgi:outer membrane protein